jgi:hypothetical protein
VRAQGPLARGWQLPPTFPAARLVGAGLQVFQGVLVRLALHQVMRRLAHVVGQRCGSLLRCGGLAAAGRRLAALVPRPLALGAFRRRGLGCGRRGGILLLRLLRRCPGGRLGLSGLRVIDRVGR